MQACLASSLAPKCLTPYVMDKPTSHVEVEDGTFIYQPTAAQFVESLWTMRDGEGRRHWDVLRACLSGGRLLASEKNAQFSTIDGWQCVSDRLEAFPQP